MTITGRMNLQVLVLGSAFAMLSASPAALAAKEAKPARPAGPVKKGLIKAATVIATPLAMITYALPSTQTQLLAGRVEQKGYAKVRDGKSGSGNRRVAKALKACSLGLYCAERLAIVSLLPGGAEAGDLTGTAEALFTDNPANGAIFVTANLALAPMTIDQFKKAINTGRLGVIAKEFGTTKADIAAVTEVAKRLGYSGAPGPNGGISESRQFFNDLHAQAKLHPGTKMSDLALIVATTTPPKSATP